MPPPSTRAQASGQEVSHCHLRYLNPFPRNLGEILGSFDKVLVPELNLGQLRSMIRAEFLIDADRPEQGSRQAVQRRRNRRTKIELDCVGLDLPRRQHPHSRSA